MQENQGKTMDREKLQMCRTAVRKSVYCRSAEIERMMLLYGAELMASPGMQLEKTFLQHGAVSVFEHSVNVACLCLWLAFLMKCTVNYGALVKGALLHDYFLYDWHVPDASHRLHGFTHPGQAVKNAERDFGLSVIERDMIRTHMFPMTPVPPRYRESRILCMADKIAAAQETAAGLWGMLLPAQA